WWERAEAAAPMSEPAPLNEHEQADLVAYLDGELAGEAARAVEAKLSLDPAARAAADALRPAWDLLDYLPPPEPSARLPEKTLSRVGPPPLKTMPQPVARPGHWRPVVWGLAWAASVVVAVWGGYRGFRALAHREPGEAELVRDLRLIENKRYYDLIDDLDFL